MDNHEQPQLSRREVLARFAAGIASIGLPSTGEQQDLSYWQQENEKLVSQVAILFQIYSLMLERSIGETSVTAIEPHGVAMKKNNIGPSVELEIDANTETVISGSDWTINAVLVAVDDEESPPPTQPLPPYMPLPPYPKGKTDSFQTIGAQFEDVPESRVWEMSVRVTHQSTGNFVSMIMPTVYLGDGVFSANEKFCIFPYPLTMMNQLNFDQISDADLSNIYNFIREMLPWYSVKMTLPPVT